MFVKFAWSVIVSSSKKAKEKSHSKERAFELRARLFYGHWENWTINKKTMTSYRKLMTYRTDFEGKVDCNVSSDEEVDIRDKIEKRKSKPLRDFESLYVKEKRKVKALQADLKSRPAVHQSYKRDTSIYTIIS